MTESLRSLGKSLFPAREVDWESVYQAELPRIYNFFRYRVGDERLAEDLTAETFEKAWRNRQRYRRDLAPFSTWLFTIARHAAADHFRKPHPEVPLEAAAAVSGGENVESLVQRRADSERLASLLSQLNERECDLVALKYGAGLTNRAIARLIHLSESNVGSLLHRVVQRLRIALEEP